MELAGIRSKTAPGNVPVWRELTGGSRLTRPIDRLLEHAGLRLVEIETGHLVSGPHFAPYHYRGRAETALELSPG